MHVIAFNGSPRKTKWNTVTLLNKVLEGAASTGAQTELVQLYDLRFSGCISCFSCKRLHRKVDGLCAVQDDLTQVLHRVREADALVIGSPVYYGTESAATRALLERLCFPYNRYAKDRTCTFPRRIKTALLYTMNVTNEMIGPMGYDKHFSLTQSTLERHFGPCELLLATNTLQYSDYSKYESELFDVTMKTMQHDQLFPRTCEQAFQLGQRLTHTI